MEHSQIATAVEVLLWFSEGVHALPKKVGDPQKRVEAALHANITASYLVKVRYEMQRGADARSALRTASAGLMRQNADDVTAA